MTVDQVTVLNTDGTILASGGDAASAAPAKMVSLEKTIGQELQDNIAKTLTPYLGLDNFEISVAARLNTDKRQTNETDLQPRVAGRALGARRQGDGQPAEQQPTAPPSASSRTSRPSRRRTSSAATSRSAPTSVARSSPTTR